MKYPKYRITCLFETTKKNSLQTFTGTEFDSSILDQPSFSITSSPFVIYLLYDMKAQHFIAVTSPRQMYKQSFGNTSVQFCHKCVELYETRDGHDCEEPIRKKRKTNCEFCGVYSGKCTCDSVRCERCKSVKKRGSDPSHRCIVTLPAEQPSNKQKFDLGEQQGNYYALWAYDIESAIKIVEHVQNQIQGFEVDDDDQYTGQVLAYEKQVAYHEANLVVCRNVFTNQEEIFSGETCLTDFLMFMQRYNRGRNLCFAHNGAGYDTRLIFDKACTIKDLDVSMSPIMRGCKFMQLKIGNVVYRDSMLHVPGSLKSLAEDFCNGELLKGYFPHLFNSIENYNYNGPIPDKKYFDISFSVKNAQELQVFNDWYDSQTGIWNFQTELLKYCQNDVLVLCKIMKGYHDILFEKFQMSPWHNTTAPSYVHEIFLRKLAMTLELPEPREDQDAYNQRVNDLAWGEYWAVLRESEYWFARGALRGGRTDIRKVYHTVTDQDWDRGVRIRYQDICSQYPYQQVIHEFPVGLPTIHVWDDSFMPCIKHKKECDCGTTNLDPYVEVVRSIKPTVDELINNPKWFGIVCATVVPSKLYHPVLVQWDETQGKSVASCNRIEKGIFTSVELRQALMVGYELVKLHRFDVYTRKPSLWADIVKELYLEKMINSKNMPDLPTQQRLINEYEDRFGMGEMLRDSFKENKWAKNPAKKKTAKVIANCGWGKHAQRPIMTEAIVVDTTQDLDKVHDFFQNCTSGNYSFKDYNKVGRLSMYRYICDGKDTRPNLHNSYLPAALFVPAYGRLQLWNQLNKLGKRVLMNDTDSIIYIYDPLLYNIPQGDIWGDWEVEDDDLLNGGIRTFVGIGPKTYGFKCENGFKSFKCKGLSLKYATENIVNFDEMESLVLEYLESQTTTILRVPQTNFTYNLGRGMHTSRALKTLEFQPNILKGVLDAQGYLYPFGYH